MEGSIFSFHGRKLSACVGNGMFRPVVILGKNRSKTVLAGVSGQDERFAEIHWPEARFGALLLTELFIGFHGVVWQATSFLELCILTRHFV